MKVWILGAGGGLGRALIDRCQVESVPFVASFRKDVDITNLEALKKAAQKVRATHVINCAAYTNVDLAETDQRRAYLVNANGAEHVGIICREMGMRVIHLSTDYVFDGTKDCPYTETDTPNPINVYGKSKFEGEERLVDQISTACIIRTSWIFGRTGSNFISSIFDRLHTHMHIDAIDDQKGSATYNRDLAKTLIDLSFHSGVFHFANRGEMSRFEILKDFFELLKDRGRPIKCQSIAPITSCAFPSASNRPNYSVLDTGKVSLALGRKPRIWKTILDEYLDLICPRT